MSEMDFSIFYDVLKRKDSSNRPSAVQHQKIDGGRIKHNVIGQEKYPHFQEKRETFYLPTGPACTNNSHSNSSETCKIQ
jgi:hypothetical protein